MLATAGPVPESRGWAFEVKFHGVRAIAYSSPDGLRLFSRNDRDITSSYPDVTATDTDAAGLGEGLVLDGELVTLDERGRPDFGLLQHRMHLAHPAAELLGQTPVQYIVFDVLRHNGDSLLAVPYRERREVLAGLGLDARGALRVPANFVDTPGSVVMDAVAAQGLEGVVAKQLDSVYVPGKRVRSWIKTAIRHIL
ncbi:RNA ligase family protein [Pseudonocardia tropica]|uniref:RNA ligase family protein n=1 Tax=Pseudonocardia tropica TaxID=681289 RepID=A0ABV1K5R3_9PSEU